MNTLISPVTKIEHQVLPPALVGLPKFISLDNHLQPVPLAQYFGQVVLIVNTASACRFTPQYAQLQALHERYAAQGLVILAYPCNQFLQQESGDNQQIAAFCERFSVDFKIMDKVMVNGADADPLWLWLRQSAPGILGTSSIKWNFTKFIVAPDGVTVSRFAPMTAPVRLESQIEALLQSKKM